MYLYAKQDIHVVTHGFRKGRKKTSMRKYLYKAFDWKKRGLNILAVALIIKTIIESDSLKVRQMRPTSPRPEIARLDS